MIISSEHFGLFYAQQDVELLAEHFLSIFTNVRVYIYVRQQAEAIEANYKQGVRSKAFAMGFHSYVKEALTTQFQRWEYYGMVNQYRRAFGDKNVIVRLYDRNHLKNGNTIDDFMALLEISHERGFASVEQRNQSLPVESLEFLRHFSPYLEKERFIALKQLIAKKMTVFNDSGYSYLSPRIEGEILCEFEQSNNLLAQLMFGAGSSQIFQQKSRIESELHGLSTEHLAKLSSKIFF